MPALHHSIFTGQMLFLTSNQLCQSTEGTVFLVTTTTTRLTALYTGRPEWAGTRRNIHSLTPCLCGYYTTSL